MTKKPIGPVTGLDLFKAIIFVASGLLTVVIWADTPIHDQPHSGWLFIGGLALTFIGAGRFIYKSLMQPFPTSNDTSQKESTK